MKTDPDRALTAGMPMTGMPAPPTDGDARSVIKFFRESIEWYNSPEERAKRERTQEQLRNAELQRQARKRERAWSAYARHDTWLIGNAIRLLFGVHPADDKRWDAIKRAHPLQLKEMEDRILDCVGHSLSVLNAKDAHNAWRVTPAVFIRWCEDMGMKVPDELSNAVKCNSTIRDDARQTLLNADVETLPAEFLRFIAAGVSTYEKMWTLYDPEDRTTAPNRQDVEQHIQSKYGLSRRAAEVLQTLIRPPETKAGGTKSR